LTVAWRHRNDSAVSAVAVPGGGHAELPGCGRRDYFV
jgi:hypothetical protein